MSLSSASAIALLLTPLLSGTGALPGSPEEVSAGLRSLSERYPDRLTLRVLSGTTGGRDVLAARLQLPGLPGDRRHAVLIVGGLEGTRAHTTQTVLGILESLLKRADEPDVRRLLETVTLDFVPLASPDAAARRCRSPRHAVPLNGRPDDADRDFRVDEDGPDDLDGDGEILSMRVPDPEGDLREYPEDPRILVPWKADDGLVPRYRLVEEGVDNDGDGRINEDGPGGVDVSRNFPHGFRAQQAASGRYPASEPEARALLDLVVSSPNLTLAVAYGAHDNLLTPPEPREEPPSRDHERRVWKADAEVYRKLGELYREVAGRDAGDRKAETEPSGARGSLHETLYHHFGILSLAVCRFGDVPPGAQPSDSEKAPEDDPRIRREKAWLDWSDRVLDGEGFADWTPFEHPDLGSVAIGGWRPYARLSPPPEEVSAWIPSETEFLVRLLEKLPRVRIHPVRIRHRGDGVFEVRASIVNLGELPTALVQGTYNRRRSPLNVELSGEGVSFLGSTGRKRLERLEGRSRAADLRWLIHGSMGQRVRIEVRLRGQTLDSEELELETGGRL